MAAEKLFEEKIKKFLDANNCWYVKYFANGYTKTGIPDLLVCVNGYFVGIEVKAPNGKPSELQLWNLKNIDKSGGFGVLLYPKDFELFKGFIQNLVTEGQDGRFAYNLLKEKWETKMKGSE